MNSSITRTRLKKLVSYDPLTGIFTWVVKPSAQVGVGDHAGSINSSGYITMKADKVNYLAHRLAWLYMTGEWPKYQIDHANGDGTDNRFSNLRECSHGQNRANSKLASNNTTGYKGVVAKKNRYQAQITHNRQVINLGSFKTKEEAHQAYCRRAKELHGEFANSGVSE